MEPFSNETLCRLSYTDIDLITGKRERTRTEEPVGYKQTNKKANSVQIWILN